MNCAADLFIKKNILGEMLYAVVCANAQLSEIACAFISIQHGNEKFLVLLRRRIYYLSLFEPQPNPQNLFSLIYGRKVVIDFTFSRVLYRRQKHLAVWHVPLSIAGDRLSPLYAYGQISILAHNPYNLPFI